MAELKKFDAREKALLRQAVLALRKSYERNAVKYAAEGRSEFLAVVQREMGFVASVLAKVEEL